MKEELLKRLEKDLCFDEKFRVRRKPAVKREFFAYADEFFAARGYGKGRADGDFDDKKDQVNLIFGDENTADVILTAHYDTPKNNAGLKPFMFLFNKAGFFAQGFSMLFVLAAVVIPAVLLGINVHFGLSVLWVALMSAWVFPNYFIFDNKFNFNDNMSGCIALFYIADKVARERPELKNKLCFVFTDKEEAGVKGAKKLKKRLLETLGSEKLAEKINLNFDCVGGRDPLNFLVTNTDGGLEIANKIAESGDFKVYKWGIVNMDTHAFKEMRSVSFCAASKRYGVSSLLESKDIHTNRDNFLNTKQIVKHSDAAYDFLKNNIAE
ncbi:MAG: Zn-dependent exopeptidase M28 [Clostridiales bacterium]|jgi:hypothetical protein|nr:Zn-dependent exopeptidase M28 [Clostridiales bacterium]